MSKARTSSSACYEVNLLVQIVMLRCDNIHNDSDTQLQSAEPNCEESGGSNQEEGEDLEFDSDENIEVDDVDDVTRTDSNNVPQLASEALFLIKRRSRFGRFIL